jgi:hypothetical protein
MLDFLLGERKKKYPVATHQAKKRMGQEPKRKEVLKTVLRRRAFIILP